MVAPSSLCSEHVCFMWPRRSLLIEPSLLDSDMLDVERRRGTSSREGAGREKALGGRTPHNQSKEDDEDVI